MTSIMPPVTIPEKPTAPPGPMPIGVVIVGNPFGHPPSKTVISIQPGAGQELKAASLADAIAAAKAITGPSGTMLVVENNGAFRGHEAIIPKDLADIMAMPEPPQDWGASYQTWSPAFKSLVVGQNDYTATYKKVEPPKPKPY